MTTARRGDPLARNSDPETSHAAAASFRARSGGPGSQKSRLEDVFRAIYPRELTAREATDMAGLLPMQSERGAVPWHRVTDLWQEGVLNRPGGTRYMPDTGEDQLLHVWVPLDERVTGVELAARRAVKINGADLTRARVAVEEVQRRLTALAAGASSKPELATYLQRQADDLDAALRRMPVIG